MVLVEKPPVDTVDIVWHTESNQSIGPNMSSTARIAVRMMYMPQSDLAD